MEYKVKEMEPFRVIGKTAKISAQNGEHHRLIADFWEQSHTDGSCEKICSINNSQNMLGITMDFDEKKEQLSYMIAIEDVSHELVTDFETREIPAAHWAIFSSTGPLPDAIVNIYSRIYREWFPATGYQQANAPILEIYPPGDLSSEGYVCEVWVPILKNNVDPNRRG